LTNNRLYSIKNPKKKESRGRFHCPKNRRARGQGTCCPAESGRNDLRGTWVEKLMKQGENCPSGEPRKRLGGEEESVGKKEIGGVGERFKNDNKKNRKRKNF